MPQTFIKNNKLCRESCSNLPDVLLHTYRFCCTDGSHFDGLFCTDTHFLNGIPYAVNCIREAFKYAIQHRWRRAAAADDERDGNVADIDHSLPAAHGPQE